MQLFFTLALAGLASAQTMSLADALASQNKTLSTLNSLLAAQPALTSALMGAQNITILAPSNDAFSKVLSTAAGMALSKDQNMVAALLQYHVLVGSHPASSVPMNAAFIPSLLTNPIYTNVTNGQVVSASLMNSKVMFMSGLKEMSMVSTADIMFTGGVIHIIDKVLTIPPPPSTSLLDSQLTALVGALTTTSLVAPVDSLKDVTIFAPSNAAFQRIGSAANMLQAMQLAPILQYHILNGTVAYSSVLTGARANSSLTMLNGQQAKTEVVSGKVFLNSAHVTITDIIVSNGVVHVLDNVLNPANSTATPVPTAATQAVAFSGVSSASNVPFTSGISATTTAPSASTMTAGAERAMGTLGVAALLGMGIAVAAL